MLKISLYSKKFSLWKIYGYELHSKDSLKNEYFNLLMLIILYIK
jgi:hypothetical protein